MLVDAPILTGNNVLVGQAGDKTMTQAGTLAPVVGVVRWTVTKSIRLTSIQVRVETAPVGSNVTLNVKRNGVPITATPIAVVVGSNVTNIALAGILTDKVNSVSGDYFTVDVVSIGSTTPGSDLTVKLNYVTTGA